MRKVPRHNLEMRDVFAELLCHPGRALNLVMENKLHHLMCVSTTAGPEEEVTGNSKRDHPNNIFQCAEYTYIVDFTTRQLSFEDSEEEPQQFVPLKSIRDTQKTFSQEQEDLVEQLMAVGKKKEAFLNLVQRFRLHDKDAIARTRDTIAEPPGSKR